MLQNRALGSHPHSHSALFPACHSFVPRHNSGSDADIQAMVDATGFKSLGALIDATVPGAGLRDINNLIFLSCLHHAPPTEQLIPGDTTCLAILSFPVPMPLTLPELAPIDDLYLIYIIPCAALSLA